MDKKYLSLQMIGKGIFYVSSKRIYYLNENLIKRYLQNLNNVIIASYFEVFLY